NDRVILDQYGASIGGGDGSRSSRPTCSGSVTLTYDDLARILEEVKQDHCGAPGEPPAAYNPLDEAEMEIADETANWFLDAYIVRLLNCAYDQDLRPNAGACVGPPDNPKPKRS